MYLNIYGALHFLIILSLFLIVFLKLKKKKEEFIKKNKEKYNSFTF